MYYIKSAGGINPLIESQGGAQDAKIKGGAQQVPKKLADKITSNRYLLNTPVAMIDHSDENGPVRVIAKDGREFHCSYVIMAMAPAMSKSIMCEPKMPGLREHLCQKMPMGHVLKTNVLFKTAWWRKKGYSGFFGNIIDDPAFPTCAGFDFTESPGIVGFVIGRNAKVIGEWTREERLNALLNQYSIMFDTPIEQVKNEYLDFAEKDWAQEEYIRGAYTGYCSPGALTLCGKALREPIGRIHFAGTETAIQWAGYMDGAIESGIRSASEVHKRLYGTI